MSEIHGFVSESAGDASALQGLGSQKASGQGLLQFFIDVKKSKSYDPSALNHSFLHDRLLAQNAQFCSINKKSKKIVQFGLGIF